MKLRTALILLVGVFMSIPCPVHSKYKGKRKPRIECQSCWDYYYEQHPEKKPIFEEETLEPVSTVFDLEPVEEVEESAFENIIEDNDTFEDVEKTIAIEFMVDYMRNHNHFSKRDYPNGIAPSSEMPDGLDYDSKKDIVSEEYLYRIASYFYDAGQEEWKAGVEVPYLLLFFLAEPETGYRTWVRGDKTTKYPNGAAHSLLQIRIEWHEKRMYHNGKPGTLVNDVKDVLGNPVKLEWDNTYDMLRYANWHIAQSLSQGRSLKSALSPWPNTRPKAMKNYNEYKD